MDFRFYHLDSNPFVTPSSNHLFWNAAYQMVWDALLERIDTRKGVTGLLGQAGLGKSALLQAYRSSADPTSIRIIDGLDAAQTPSGLLANLAQACGLTLADTGPEDLFSAIYEHCHSAHANGHQVVWLIDDAHTLSLQALGNLHKLYERLHRRGEPLLQLVLCGRPTLRQRCQHPDLYLFEQALLSALTLSPLNAEDRTAYIHHYLQGAASLATPIFSKGALKLITEQTHGIPNMINITCSDVLVAGLLAAEKPISAATVQAVLGDDVMHIPSIPRWGLAGAAGLLLLAGLWSLVPERPWTSPAATATAASQTPLASSSQVPSVPQMPEAPSQVPSVSQMPKASSQAPPVPSPTPPVQAAVPEVQVIPDAPPAQTIISKPKVTGEPAVATAVEAENTIRTFRQRQQEAEAQAAEADRVESNATQTQVSDIEPPRESASLPAVSVPVNTPVNTDVARVAVHVPEPAIEPEAPVVPAAFTQPAPEPVAYERRSQPEAAARPGNGQASLESPVGQPPQPAGTRAALIASTKARLLCALPRTGGRRGSDIVLLGHTRHSVYRLIDDGSQNMSPVLSPDGTLLAYTSYRGGAPNIYLRDLASGRETQLTSSPWLALPGTWSPNGRYLSLSHSVNGNNDIFIYDMAQKRLRRLTRHKGIDVSPSFAPDSQRLVFSSDRTGSPQLYITDITGGPPVRLTRTGAYNTSPSWSPQEDRIAFVGRSSSAALDLYMIKPDGSGRQRLTQGQRFHTPPAWLPNGRTLMGMSLRGAAWERHVVQLNPDRAAPTLPKPESLCLAPQWVAYRAP